MQTHSAPIEITRRFSSVNASKEQRVKSETIAQQVAEYEASGGKIKTIPTGTGALSAGAVIASEDPNGMAVPRNSKRNIKTKTAKGSPEITVAEAAELIGKSTSYIAKQIASGQLQSHKTEGFRAHFLKRKDVLALKESLEQGNI